MRPSASEKKLAYVIPQQRLQTLPQIFPTHPFYHEFTLAEATSLDH